MSETSETYDESKGGRLSRRTLLFAAAGLTMFTGLGGLLGWNGIRKWLIARNIESHFHYLKHDRSAVYQFIELFEENIHVLRNNPLSMLSPLPKNAYLSYLASTDYFSGGEDEAKVLSFRGLWYPRHGACMNPFSQRLLPDGQENDY